MSRERFVWTRFARKSSASARAHSIVSLHRDSRTLRRFDTTVAPFRGLSQRDRFRRILTRASEILDRSIEISRFVDRPARSIVRSGSDSLDSIKDQPAEKLHKRRRRRRVTTAINEHPERPCLDLCADKNHSRKLDDPRTATPKFPRGFRV